MISIPIAIPNPTFEWMANFWSYMQTKVYNSKAKNNSLLAVVKKNHINDPEINKIDWNINNLNYTITNSIYDYVASTNRNCVVINVFSALKDITKYYSLDETICITDMDVVPLKPYNGPLPKDNEIICYDGYEDWHMFIANESKQNYNKIKKYLTHFDNGYINGGFVPILIKNKTLQLIIDEVIYISEKIIEDPNETSEWKWWACMTALSIACHNNKIVMKGYNNTYIPGYNKFNLDDHYWAHYSVDKIFNKHQYPNIDISKFPNNNFYNYIKEWMLTKPHM